MKKFGILIVLAVIVVLVVVFAGNDGRLAIDTEAEPVKIGAILSLTGPAAPYGEAAQEGLELAVGQINDGGGVDGRELVLIIEDDQTSGTDAASAFQKLVDVDNVQGIIGGVWDFNAQAIMPLAEAAEIPFITPSNMYIPEAFELNDWSFAMLPDFEQVIRHLEDAIVNIGSEKMGIVHYTSSFGAEIARVLGDIMTEQGGELVADETYTEIGAKDFRTQILKLKAAEVDTVFLDMLSFDTSAFLAQAAEQDFNPQIVTYYGGAEDIFNPDVDTSNYEGAIVLDWEVSSPKFKQLYKNTYDHEPVKSADKNYDAVYVLAEALEVASKTEIRANTFIADSTFKTINGSISFTDINTVESARINVYRIESGELVTIN